MNRLPELLQRILLITAIGSLAPVWAAQALQTLDQAEEVPAWEDQPEFESLELEAQQSSDIWSTLFKQMSGSSKVQWGIDFDGAKPLHLNADSLMMPASTQKVMTAITALQRLGRDFKFRSVFQGDLDVITGTLRSPEFIVVGDPTWGHPKYDKSLSQRVNALAAELRQRGVKQIIGPIKVTNSVPGLEEWVRPEGTEASGPWRPSWRFESFATVPTTVMLNQNEATFKITGYRSASWLTAGLKAPLEVNLLKKRGGFKIEQIMDSHLRVQGYRLTGGMPTARTFHVPIHAGEGWLEGLALAAFARAGIFCTTPDPRMAKKLEAMHVLNLGFLAGIPMPPKLTIAIDSPPLHEMLIPFVEHSLNIVGDRLFIELAHRGNGEDATSIIHHAIQNVTHGTAALQDVKIQDGSGLRLDNAIRPSVLRDVLAGVRDEAYFDDFFRTLAVAGKSGTLQYRLEGATTSGRIYGKTGTIKGVRNLVGYYRQKNGGLEPFVILTHTRSIDDSAITPMTDRILVEFARQNGGLANVSKRAGAAASGEKRSR